MKPREVQRVLPPSPNLRTVGCRLLHYLLVVGILLCFALPAEAKKRRRKGKKRKPKPAASAPKSPPTIDVEKRDAAPGSLDSPAPSDAEDDTSGSGKDEPDNYDFTGVDLSAKMRTPQLLYFLERANEELRRAALKRRSFVPEVVRSIDEEGL